MKRGNLPLIHLERLRRPAEAAGCLGLLAMINAIPALMQQRHEDPKTGAKIVNGLDTTTAPVGPVAWAELHEAVQAKYGPKIEEIENAASEDEGDCIGLTAVVFYLLIGAAEVIPTLRLEVRGPIDKFFGELPQIWQAQAA